MNIKNLIIKFIDLIKEENIEIYNEAALQYELAIFLRKEHPEYKIQLERNIEDFNFEKSNFKKKEMDIIIYKDKNRKQDMIVIELKAIINQHKARPVTVFNWIEDLIFLEQLKEHGIQCYSIFYTNENNYFIGENKTGKLLTDFRNKKIFGTYQKHQKTQKTNDIVTLKKMYHINLETVNEKEKYFIIEI
jgi:L-rhamnose mutarotase